MIQNAVSSGDRSQVYAQKDDADDHVLRWSKERKGRRVMAIKIALAGNPNCGKTTMFNALTGANQYVGNW